jgi:hypothetical protein
VKGQLIQDPAPILVTPRLRRDVDPDAPAESIPLLLHGLAVRSTSPLNQRNAAADLGLHAGCAEPDMTALTESTLAMHPARAIDNIDEGRLIANDTVALLLA